MQSDRISSVGTHQRIPRRSMQRNTSTLRNPRSHNKIQTSTRDPYSHPSSKITNESYLFCACLFPCAFMFFYFFLSLAFMISYTKFKATGNYIFAFVAYGLVAMAFLLFLIVLINIIATATRQTAIPRETTIKLCEFCYYNNDISNKKCLKCGALLPLPSESMMMDEKSLYLKTLELPTFTESVEGINSKSPLCHLCGHIIDVEKDQCPKCGVKRIECSICKQYLNYDDDIAYCFFCETNFHFSHLMEWIKIRGKCPTCKKRLLMSEVVRRYTYEK